MDNKEVKNKEGLTEEEFLKSYRPDGYEKPSVTVDMLIFTVMDERKANYRKLSEKQLKLLMIKRGNHPFIGHWALPGGFVDIDESLESAAERELREETGIENMYMEQLYTWGAVKRDPRMRVISCSYMALVDSSNLTMRAGDDAQDAKWFSVQCKTLKEEEFSDGHQQGTREWKSIELLNEEDCLSAVVLVTKTLEGKVEKVSRELISSNAIAFDHALIIEYAVGRLRNKVLHTDIAFNLMPEKFTLTELQQVYEVILGKKLLKANFRRKISDKVIETEEYTKEAGHRPSKLYCFNGERRGK